MALSDEKGVFCYFFAVGCVSNQQFKSVFFSSVAAELELALLGRNFLHTMNFSDHTSPVSHNNPRF